MVINDQMYKLVFIVVIMSYSNIKNWKAVIYFSNIDNLNIYNVKI